MDSLTGKIVEIFLDKGTTRARVLVDGSYMVVPLMLLMDARIGDRVLIDAGVAISRIKPAQKSEV